MYELSVITSASAGQRFAWPVPALNAPPFLAIVRGDPSVPVFCYLAVGEIPAATRRQSD